MCASVVSVPPKSTRRSLSRKAARPRSRPGTKARSSARWPIWMKKIIFWWFISMLVGDVQKCCMSYEKCFNPICYLLGGDVPYFPHENVATYIVNKFTTNMAHFRPFLNNNFWPVFDSFYNCFWLMLYPFWMWMWMMILTWCFCMSMAILYTTSGPPPPVNQNLIHCTM